MVMKVAVLVAYGANSLEIPCRIFEDIETGSKRCEEIFGVPGTVRSNGMVVWTYKDVNLEDGSEQSEAISNKLFTNHYYGCGGPDRFVLKEVASNEAFTCFDLD